MTLTDHITAITNAAALIPQQLADRDQHSPEWRILLQAIRNMGTPTMRASALGGFTSVYNAALDVNDANDPAGEAKSAVLLLIVNAAIELGILKADAA